MTDREETGGHISDQVTASFRMQEQQRMQKEQHWMGPLEVR